MLNGTKLRHISHTSLDALEAIIEGLPDKVEIKSILHAPLRHGGAQEWVVCFTIHDNSPADPRFSSDLTNRKKRGK
jgi:hypothetical protein